MRCNIALCLGLGLAAATGCSGGRQIPEQLPEAKIQRLHDGFSLRLNEVHKELDRPLFRDIVVDKKVFGGAQVTVGSAWDSLSDRDRLRVAKRVEAAWQSTVTEVWDSLSEGERQLCLKLVAENCRCRVEDLPSDTCRVGVLYLHDNAGNVVSDCKSVLKRGSGYLRDE